jgi:hypothetical protein
MATRAEIITKTVTDLADLAFGISTTDTAGNPFYYALNDACAQYGVASTDLALANASNEQIRIISLGTQMFIIRRMIKKYITTPRVDKDAISRDKFGRLTELYRLVRSDFKDALSGEDRPNEINRPGTEQVVTWTTGYDDDNNNANDFRMDDLGRDLTTYSDDGE